MTLLQKCVTSSVTVRFRQHRRCQFASSNMDVDTVQPTAGEGGKKVVVITNLTRNVAETHLSTIFGFYGEVVKIDLPVFGKCKSPLLQPIMFTDLFILLLEHS